EAYPSVAPELAASKDATDGTDDAGDDAAATDIDAEDDSEAGDEDVEADEEGAGAEGRPTASRCGSPRPSWSTAARSCRGSGCRPTTHPTSRTGQGPASSSTCRPATPQGCGCA